MLSALVTVYPDVDPRYLQQVCVRLFYNHEEIELFLEKNIDQIPEKRQVQAINRWEIQSRIFPPGCRDMLAQWVQLKQNSN